MAHRNIPTVPLWQVRDQLKGYPDDFEVSFNGLDFNRVTQKGPKFLLFEFNQTVDLDDAGNVVVRNPD